MATGIDAKTIPKQVRIRTSLGHRDETIERAAEYLRRLEDESRRVWV